MIESFLIRIFILGYKAHRKTASWLIKVISYGLILTEAFWLTVLSRKALKAIDDFHYSRSGKYKDKDFNKSMLNDWEEKMVLTYFSECKTIMVLASGGGREVYALEKMGFNVEGYECNKTLVEVSVKIMQDEGIKAHIAWVPPNHCPDNKKKYDGIILGWGAYIHVKGRETRINLLKEISSHLSDDGPFMLSFWYANEYMEAYCEKISRINKKLCKILKKQAVEKGERLSPFSGKYFTFDEVEQEMNEAGFNLIYKEARPYGHVVAKKI